MAVREQRLADEQIQDLMADVPDWELAENSIKQEFVFGDFDQAMDFVNKVAEIARELDHHPNMCIYYNKVELELTTHRSGGLSEEDFELAREINKTVNSEQ